MGVSEFKAEDQFRKVMGICCLFFVLGAVLFAFVPDTMVAILNWIGHLFSKRSVAPIISKIPVDNYWATFYGDMPKFEGLAQLPSHGMYVALAVAYMVMIATICGAIFYDPKRYGLYAPLVILGKLASSLTGLGLYLWSYPYFVNLIVFITDFPIALIILFFYLRARSSLTAATPSA